MFVMASMVRGIWELMLCWRAAKLVVRALSSDCIAEILESCGDGRSWQRQQQHPSDTVISAEDSVSAVLVSLCACVGKLHVHRADMKSLVKMKHLKLS